MRGWRGGVRGCGGGVEGGWITGGRVTEREGALISMDFRFSSLFFPS